jgi:hypothetical protein
VVVRGVVRLRSGILQFSIPAWRGGFLWILRERVLEVWPFIGHLSGLQVAVATERDWEVRIMHLREIHKFRECNKAKQFFRADHSRQHLKYSHASSSGKWTTMLENACMKDEQRPEPVRGGNSELW